VAFRQNRNQTTFRRGARRQTEWGICTVPTGFTNVAASTKAILVLVPAATLEPESPATIVRSRFLLTVNSDQKIADEVQVGAFGIGFVNTVAATLGITALPGPSTDCAWGGWFVWQAFLNEFVFGQAGASNVFNAGDRYIIDSKAMRKFESDQALVMMVENAGTAGIRVALAGRMLVKAG